MIIHLIYMKRRLVDFPKVTQIVSGRSGPELRSVSSGYFREPGLCSKLQTQQNSPQGSPHQLLPGLPGVA